MRLRLERARRLLAVEVKRVAAAERALAMSRQRHAERRAAAVRAEEVVTAAYDQWLDVVSAEELAQASAHRSVLHARVAAARAALAHAEDDVRAHEVALVAARTAERRMEILIEGFERALAARESKTERRLADEHGSRMSGPIR